MLVHARTYDMSGCVGTAFSACCPTVKTVLGLRAIVTDVDVVCLLMVYTEDGVPAKE